MEPGVPPEDLSPHIVDPNFSTFFFIGDNGRRMVTTLKNWEDDKQQTVYQRVALRMATSIRVSR